jgi:uncharacterized membrane protein YidH (DUF202 family)
MEPGRLGRLRAHPHGDERFEMTNAAVKSTNVLSSTEAVPKDRGTILAEERTDLAYRRSVIAAERTLMAWIRTSISMIGFGFTIYKFFQYLPEDIAKGNIRRPQAPRNLGLTLIALGTLALAGAAWQHLHFLKQIGAGRERNTWSISFLVAIFVVLIGVLTFYGVLLRHGPY